MMTFMVTIPFIQVKVEESLVLMLIILTWIGIIILQIHFFMFIQNGRKIGVEKQFYLVAMD